MRTPILTLAAVALCLPLAGCPKKGSAGNAGADGGTETVASASASATASEATPPPPPPDANTSCTVTLTGKKVVDSSNDPALEYTIKNTGTHELRFCQIYTFGYDKTGKVAGKGGLSDNRVLKPGEQATSSLHVRDDKSANVVNTPGLTFASFVQEVIFTDDSKWEDKGFDFMKGPGPQAATAASAATASPATAAAGTAKPPVHPGRPAPPAPPRH